MVQPSWGWVLMGVVSTALNPGKWASYNGVALEKQRKNSLIFMHRLTCRRTFVLLRWCFHCFRYMKQQKPQFVVSYPKKSYRCYTIHWAIYEKEQLPDNTNKTSRGLEKTAAWPKGTRGFNNRLIIWFHRRRYRTVKIVLLRMNKKR